MQVLSSTSQGAGSSVGVLISDYGLPGSECIGMGRAVESQ